MDLSNRIVQQRLHAKWPTCARGLLVDRKDLFRSHRFRKGEMDEKQTNRSVAEHGVQVWSRLESLPAVKTIMLPHGVPPI
jgi:hypothetical protein